MSLTLTRVFAVVSVSVIVSVVLEVLRVEFFAFVVVVDVACEWCLWKLNL